MKITVYVVITEVEGERAVSGFPSIAERTEFLIDLMRTLGKDRISSEALEAAIGQFERGEEHVEGPWELVRHDSLDGVWLDEIEIDLALPAPVAEALRNTSGAICSLQEQIDQMSGMFSDSDGAIAQAMKDGDEALAEIKAMLG